MDKAIDGRKRHSLVWEDLAPFAEWLIGCDHHGPPLVTRGDQLEQDARLGLILGDIGDVVEDKQIVAVELGDRAFEGQFATSNLEPLQPGKTYELWLIPAAAGGSPIPAGTFRPDERGNASVILPPLPKGVEAKAFGVTVEDEGGAATPTQPIILAGE